MGKLCFCSRFFLYLFTYLFIRVADDDDIYTPTPEGSVRDLATPAAETTQHQKHVKTKVTSNQKFQQNTPKGVTTISTQKLKPNNNSYVSK